MNASNEQFGLLETGEPVELVVLSGGGLKAKVITWGAVIQDLRLDGHEPPLVLGMESLSDYIAHSPYFGATPGRNANRIADEAQAPERRTRSILTARYTDSHPG